MKFRTNILCFAAAIALGIAGSISAREKENTVVIDPAAPVILIRNATILTVSHGTIDRGDILIKDGKIAAVGGTLKVEFVDVLLTLAPDKQSAVADLTARMQPAGGELNVQEIKLTLKKVDGQWLVTRAETVRTFN